MLEPQDLRRYVCTEPRSVVDLYLCPIEKLLLCDLCHTDCQPCGR